MLVLDLPVITSHEIKASRSYLSVKGLIPDASNDLDLPASASI